jgi:spore coat polysaccharide biosynthesis predicted glycosyltransferase SpsG
MALIEVLSLQDNIACVVLTRALPDFIINRLEALKATCFLLDDANALTSEIDAIKNVASQHQAKAIVLDGYQFDVHYRQALYASTLHVITFDDSNDLEALYCDLVINALPFAFSIGYEISAPQATHLLGLEYSIIRQEFLQQKNITFKKRNKLLINFGGSDVANLTLPLVTKLLALELIDSPEDIIVITGGAYYSPEKMNLLALKFGFQHIHNCQNMAEILYQCKLAICAPGSIVYELAYCGVPSIFLTVADNQLLSAQAHQNIGWCKVVNGLEHQGIEHALLHLSQLWNAPSALIKLSETAIKLIDGKGVKRICSAIKELLI